MTRKAPKEERVEEILNAAVSEFVERGYEGASMDSIARRAGLTKGGLYHHFRSKDEILLAANVLFMKPIEELMAEANAAKSPLEGLRRYLHRYLEYWVAHPRETMFVFLSLAKVIPTEELWSVYQAYCAQVTGFFQALLQRAVAARELPPHDAKARAIAIASALDGGLGYLVMVPGFGPDDMGRWFEDVFLDSLGGSARG